MVRKKIRENLNNSGFKLRGVGATRIEALSDGVFAIAIALLLISASFPETYAELRIFMYDFIPIWDDHCFTYSHLVSALCILPKIWTPGCKNGRNKYNITFSNTVLCLSTKVLVQDSILYVQGVIYRR